jgi:ferredoxin
MHPDNTPRLFTGRAEQDAVQFDAPSNQPLLLSLEQGGANWPSSCRAGNCRTCVGQLLSGTVRYEMDWPGLTSEEMANGCVLPCVAYPCSNVVLRPGY